MATTPSLKEQLEFCEIAVNALKNLSDAIDISKQNINNTILALQEEVFIEYVNDLILLQEQFVLGEKETQDFISEKHIAYLQTQIEHIISRL